MLSRTILAVTLLGAALAVEHGDDHGDITFGYHYADEDGPANWASELGFTHCAGFAQSPIDIRTSKTVGIKNSELPDLEFEVNETDNGDFVENTGAGYAIIPGNEITMMAGPLGESYYLDHVFIRHGRSEHQINGSYKKAELQMHFKANAVDSARPHAMYSVLVNRGSANEEMQKIINVMNNTLVSVDDLEEHDGHSHDHLESDEDYWASDLMYNDLPREVPELNLLGLFPSRYERDFYHYLGSMTMPPCSQDVMWIIPRRYITMSREQLEFFYTYKDNKDELLDIEVGNTRPEQEKNARVVVKSFGSTSCGSRGLGGISSLLSLFG